MTMSLDAFKTSNANFNDSVANIINASRAINEARDQERRALLERAKFATLIGDKDIRNEALTDLRNGHGVAGFLKNIFGSEKGANPVESTVGLDMSGGNEPRVSWEQKVLNPELVKEGTIRPELLANAYSAVGNAKGNTGYVDSKGENVSLKNGTYKQVSADFDKRVNEVTNLNKKIIAENANNENRAKAEAYKNYKVNPDAYYRDVMKSSGNYVNEFTGNKANMIAQNQRMYETLIQAAIDKGDYKRAERFNREYKANLASIDKNWGDDRGGKYEDLFDIRDYLGKGKGEKYVDVPVQRKLKGTPAFEAYVNTEHIPESVYRKGKPAIQKYLAERDPHSYGGDVIESIATPKGDQTTSDQKENREIDEKNKYFSERLAVGKALIENGRATGNAMKIAEGEKALQEASLYFGIKQ